MSKTNEIKKHFKGLTVNGKHQIEEVDWFLDKAKSTETKIYLQSYDANLYGLPNISTWPNTDWKQKQFDEARKHFEGFDGEVWLDDVKLRR
jgi:hypothetical protein